jgi:8-oxo-dGTP diphosphatase
MATSRERRISAAGTVTFRPGTNGVPDVLLVHRPRYDDWSLPKGKLAAGEYLAGCATRETWEETAARVRLGVPVDRISYPVGGGVKEVSYWRARVVEEGRHQAGSEVDEAVWLSVPRALRQLTYVDERAVLQQATNLTDSVPLLIVRHAKAMLRSRWSGRDQARPLDERGRRQARLLIPLLEAYGVRRLVSSSSVRCAKTLQPFAKSARLDVEPWNALTEEQAKADPKALETMMRRLVADVAQSGVPTAVCGHRPVLPAMLETAGVVAKPLQPGAVLVVHLRPDADVLAIEVHKPRV